MKGIFVFLILGLVLVSVFASAQMMGYGRPSYGRLNMYEYMEKVMESGTYDDMLALREEYNMPMMYWVDSPEDFQQARQAYFGNADYSSMPCHR
jgi:hypothetical protein